MAFVCVDYDGRESLFSSMPIRSDVYDDEMGCFGQLMCEIQKHEELMWLANNYPCDHVILPKGSIKKLIGRELTWNDEPVELT